MLNALAVLMVPLLQVAAPAAGEPTRILGDSIRLGNGIVRSWIEVDDGGAPTAIGVTLPDEVIESAPPDGAMLSLAFPALDGLPFRHVLFDWAPAGHPPATLYAHPHWDAHFYLITPEARRAIRAGETPLRPEARYMPDGFQPVPGLGLYAFPEMGVHWMHESAPELHGSDFDQTIIYGSIGERTIFVEPMFTSLFLRARPDFSAPIPQPRSVAESGYYPTRYVIRCVASERACRISLEGFRWRDAEGEGARRQGSRAVRRPAPGRNHCSTAPHHVRSIACRSRA